MAQMSNDVKFCSCSCHFTGDQQTLYSLEIRSHHVDVPAFPRMQSRDGDLASLNSEPIHERAPDSLLGTETGDLTLLGRDALSDLTAFSRRPVVQEYANDEYRPETDDRRDCSCSRIAESAADT